MRTLTAKILVHSDGLGTPDAEQVRQRAAELAIINGRTQFTEADWQQARLELHGHGPDGLLSDEMAMPAMVSEADMLSVDVGHHVPRVPLEDERSPVEELIQEGLEEAEHELMLEASRAQAEASEEEEP